MQYAAEKPAIMSNSLLHSFMKRFLLFSSAAYAHPAIR